MAVRYIYKGKKYQSLWQVRQAVGEQQNLVYGNPQTEQEFEAYGISVKFEEYDPFLETPIDEVKTRLYSRLDQEFQSYRNSSRTYIESSLGFKVNANITAFNNVQGVIVQAEAGASTLSPEGKVAFTDFDDNIQMLDIEQLKTIQLEISVNGSRAYGVKWAYREQIEKATSHEELRNLTFNFN